MHRKPALEQGTISTLLSDRIDLWAESFLIDRRARGLSEGTLRFYRNKFIKILNYFDQREVSRIAHLTPSEIRQFLLWLEEEGHTLGGVHAYFRVLRAFLLWWEEENEPEDWRNPIRKVAAPRVRLEPLEPVPMQTVKRLLSACGSDLTGVRDKALFLILLDTGLRASECLGVNLDDLDPATFSLLVRKTKNGKPRTAFIGRRTRRAVRRYLRMRDDHSPALWVSDEGLRLTYWGLRSMVRRRSLVAGVNPPRLHDFRRSFALEALRRGMDIVTLSKLMGHSDLQVLTRYLAQVTEDLRVAHSRYSPVDGLLEG